MDRARNPRDQTLGCLLRNTAIILCLALLVVFCKPIPVHAAEPSVPSVRIKVEVRGVQRTDGFKYQYDMVCAHSSGAAVPASDGKEKLAVSVGRGETITVGLAEFPTLTLDDSCWIRASLSDGSEASYKTTNGTRADGTARDSSPGMIASGSFRSASAQASGELITVTHSYNGDLVVTSRIEGIPVGGRAVVPISIRCDNQGISRTLNLGDGDRELITGIPTGSSCRVSTLAGRSVVQDNSGAPNDGIVVISAIRPECLDLRNASPDCRATVAINTAYEPALNLNRETDTTESTTSTTTTTNPDDQQNRERAAPATAAPAVAPSPAVAVDATPTFTG